MCFKSQNFIIIEKSYYQLPVAMKIIHREEIKRNDVEGGGGGGGGGVSFEIRTRLIN